MKNQSIVIRSLDTARSAVRASSRVLAAMSLVLVLGQLAEDESYDRRSQQTGGSGGEFADGAEAPENDTLIVHGLLHLSPSQSANVPRSCAKKFLKFRMPAPQCPAIYRSNPINSIDEGV